MSSRTSMDAKHRPVLRQYLLGALPEAERSRVAEQYFVDEQFFEELLDVENELLDQYVRGQLSPEERKKFGEYLAGLPNGAGKLATAHALMEAARERRKILPRPSAVTASSSRSRWTPSGGQPARGLVWKYAIAAVLIVSFAALGFLIVTQRRLRREVEQLRVAHTQAEQDKSNLTRQAQTAEREAAGQQEQIRQLQAELDRARSNAPQQTRPETTG